MYIIFLYIYDMNKSDKRRKEWENRENNNLCVYCGKNTPFPKKKGCSECLDKKSKSTLKFSKNNRYKINQYNFLIKHLVIEKYGGKCVCCGENEILFLTIDHINNNGKDERSIKKNYNTSSFYLKLKREKVRDDLQVLCFNCNLGKSVNNGICPHIEIKRKLDPVYDRRHIPQFDTRLKIIWPNDDDLIKMCNEKSINEVSKELKVNFSSVSGRLKRRNKYHLVNKKYGGVRYGENNKSSKLNKEKVIEIRRKNINGVDRNELSKEYDVSKSLIDKIITNKVWIDIH